MLANQLVIDGVDAAEELLAEVFRVDVAKALNPLDPGDFLRVIFRLQQALIGVTGPAEATAMASALDMLDIDWTTAPVAKMEAVMRAANKALQDAPKKVMPSIEATLRKSFIDVAGGTMKKSRTQFNLDVALSLTVQDKKVAKHAAKAQAHYVRDEYGKRADRASEVARKVVADGLKNGLGRVEIGARLESSLQVLNANRSRAYYNMVASVHAGRSRQYASLRSYDSAGVDGYRFEAVMDEVTTLQCRFMHGREFNVKADLKRYKAVASSQDPEDVTILQPWVNVGKDANGDEYLYVKGAGGARDRIASVVSNAVGELDEPGDFSTKLTDKALQAKGCTCPPLHGNCRSTIVPLV